jgi:nucleotide-binding universal stress UspA family protein
MSTLVQDLPVNRRFTPARGAWRSILTHVQPQTDAQPRLAVAVDLARKLDATLIGVGVEMLQPIGASDPFGMLGGEFITAMREVIQSNLADAEAAFREATTGLQSQWLSLEDMPDRAVARLARGADVIVAGGSPLKHRDSYGWCNASELILKCGRPVLVAPPQGGELAARGVVIAWKDTREARRALADSLPILKCAEEVLLLEVCLKEEAADIAPHHGAVLEHLARHGVTARSKIVPGEPNFAADTLQNLATGLGADLIVAGGYGHTRLGEWVMGGVTADLLADPQRFVLFSH